jgi:serine protease DegS
LTTERRRKLLDSGVDSRFKVTALIVQSVLLGLAVAFIVVLVKPSLIRPAADAGDVARASYAAAVAASSPAVANVYTTINRLDGAAAPDRVLGSAVVIDPNGYLVTNWHVIRGADRIRVQLADGRVAVPTLVGADPDTEIALLRIDAPNLPSIALGRSDSLQVGDVVLAIGNSLGLSHTVTMGIVSATGRGQLGVTTFEDFIQTDAAINVGNSGGALVNAKGELVGINTAITSSTARDPEPPEGIGFAIPINLVRGVMTELIANGRVIRGHLGIEGTDLPPRLARVYGLERPAFRLDVVAPGSSAEAAGLKAGDVLAAIGADEVASERQATNLIAAGRPGDRVRIRVARAGGEVFETEAVLEERPQRDGT